MKIANDLVIYEVVIKQNLRAFLDISGAGGGGMCATTYTLPIDPPLPRRIRYRNRDKIRPNGHLARAQSLMINLEPSNPAS